MGRRKFTEEYGLYLTQRLAHLSPEAAQYRLAAEELYAILYNQPVGLLISGPAALVRLDLLDRAGEDLDVLISADIDPDDYPESVGGFPVEYTCLDFIQTTNDPHVLRRVQQEIAGPRVMAPASLSLLLKLNPFRPKDVEDLSLVLSRSADTRRYLSMEMPFLQDNATELFDDRLDLLAYYGVL